MVQTSIRRAVFLVLPLLLSAQSLAVDHVVFRHEGKEIALEGRVLVTAQDGGLLVLARDGVLWTVPPEDQLKHTKDDRPFQPFSADDISKQLLARLPQGFEAHQTAHYLILYNTSRGYAQWCGALFERLYRAFTNYWSRKGLQLTEPEFPLVAIIFADQRSYVEFSQPEVGDAVSGIIGYFSLASNRMTMYDLSGIEAARRSSNGRGSSAQLNQILSQPDASRQVATIVHEATHQIAFNCGLHNRYSDCPLWFSEGIAIYFETPDLSSSKGWRGIGDVHRSRLSQFHQYLRRRPADSLHTLLRDDTRFRDPKQGLDAYAEAWSLTYFLVRQRPKQYLAYLKMLSEKPPLIEDGPDLRLKQFRQFFGDLDRLDSEFVRYMTQVR